MKKDTYVKVTDRREGIAKLVNERGCVTRMAVSWATRRLTFREYHCYAIALSRMTMSFPGATA